MADATAQKTKPETASKPVAKTGKRAVISTGGHQFLVGVGDEILVELLDPAQQTTAFEALLVIDGDTISVGTPTVTGVKVTADILEQSVKDDKVVAIRYKAKKRVHKVRGHRQRHAKIKITGIK